MIDLAGLDPEIIPDGTGFFARNTAAMNDWDEALNGKKKLDQHSIEAICGQSAWIVDLAGVLHRLTWDASALHHAEAVYAQEMKDAPANGRAHFAMQTRLLSNQKSKWQWNGARNQKGSTATALLLGLPQGAMHIDIARKTITYLPGLTIASGDDETELSPAIDSGPSVLLLKMAKLEYRLNILEKKSPKVSHYVAALEANWPADGKTKVLASRVNITEISRLTKASPNRQYAVLKYEEPSTNPEEYGSRVHFLIVDNAGNFLDRLVFLNVTDDGISVGAPNDLPNPKK